MNLRSFKLNRVYLYPLNMSNAGDFSWSWILKGFYSGSKRGREIRCHMSTSSIKHQIRRLHVVVMQWTSEKCTKKRDAHAELLFWSLNLLFFWSRRCGRRHICLSSLITMLQCAPCCCLISSCILHDWIAHFILIGILKNPTQFLTNGIILLRVLWLPFLLSTSLPSEETWLAPPP